MSLNFGLSATADPCLSNRLQVYFLSFLVLNFPKLGIVSRHTLLKVHALRLKLFPSFNLDEVFFYKFMLIVHFSLFQQGGSVYE